MTAMTKYFFDAVYSPGSPWTVVGWWEVRRPTYNVAVGSAGLLTIGVLGLLGQLPPVWVIGPMALAYGFVANVCYSFGSLADLAARRLGGSAFAPVGPALLRYGFVFSVGLTLLPVPIASLGWLARLVLRIVT